MGLRLTGELPTDECYVGLMVHTLTASSTAPPSVGALQTDATTTGLTTV